MIDWGSLLRRYMALNYVPEDGSIAAAAFSAEELATLRLIEHQMAQPTGFTTEELARFLEHTLLKKKAGRRA